MTIQYDQGNIIAYNDGIHVQSTVGGVDIPSVIPTTPSTAVTPTVLNTTEVLPQPILDPTKQYVLVPQPDIIQTSQVERLKLQVAQEGFGSYLQGILPDEIAISAGAFSATMQQVKNILNIDFEKFSQVAYGIETTKGLNLVNGTDVPADLDLASLGYNLTALGSGPFGTYTMSDFFGCMSGLPYPWKNLYDGILDLQTDKLKTIYQQLYLAVTWEQATVSVQYTSYDDGYGTTYYHVTGLTLTDPGGGYGRSAATAPTITISNGGSGTTTIGTDSNNFTTYGRVLTVSLASAGPDSTSIPTASVQCPPTAYIAYPFTGGTNTAAGTTWSSGSVNTAVAGLIADANAEIAVIRTTNPIKAVNLNTLHDATGTQLTTEQRARFTGIAPVPQDKRDKFLNIYPSALMVFVDSIPELAKNTLPHMQTQTLEAISNLDLTAGQSVVAALREARNTVRLDAIGSSQDNIIPGALTPEEELELLINGTTLSEPPLSIDQPKIKFTSPAFLNNTLANTVVSPIPTTYYNNKKIITTSGATPGNPAVLIPLSEKQQGVENAIPPSLFPKQLSPNAPTIFNTPQELQLKKQQYPNIPQITPSQLPIVGSLVPQAINKELDVGKAPPGSLAPSKAINLLPPNLKFASGTTLPNTFTVPEAIDEVIKCNCDCWIP